MSNFEQGGMAQQNLQARAKFIIYFCFSGLRAQT